MRGVPPKNKISTDLDESQEQLLGEMGGSCPLLPPPVATLLYYATVADIYTPTPCLRQCVHFTFDHNVKVLI